MICRSPIGASCPVCDQSKPEVFKIYYDGCVKLYRCSQCGFVAQYPGPGSNRIGEDYTKYKLTLANDSQWEEPWRAAGLKDIALRVARYALGGGRWLDVGCGDGHFMSVCKSLGFNVMGVEASPTKAEYAASMVGVEVQPSYYKQSLFSAESFDVMSFIQVLEHTPKPKRILQAAWYHLRRGGLIVIEVPSICSPHFLAYRLTGIKWFVRPPNGVIASHVGYYSPRSLSTLVMHENFSPVEFVTGRWQVKYSGFLSRIATITDPILDLLKVGGILLIARKEN
jgi:SAM-dependent methyltransferase